MAGNCLLSTLPTRKFICGKAQTTTRSNPMKCTATTRITEGIAKGVNLTRCHIAVAAALATTARTADAAQNSTTYIANAQTVNDKTGAPITDGDKKRLTHTGIRVAFDTDGTPIGTFISPGDQYKRSTRIDNATGNQAQRANIGVSRVNLQPGGVPMSIGGAKVALNASQAGTATA